MRLLATDPEALGTEVYVNGQRLEGVISVDTDTMEIEKIVQGPDGKFIHDRNWVLQTEVIKPEGGFVLMHKKGATYTPRYLPTR